MLSLPPSLFTEEYSKLTLKGVMWLNWVSANCPGVRWVIKIDDDVAVNVHYLVEYLTQEHGDTRHFIGGSLATGGDAKISRAGSGSKWQVDDSQFPGLEHFPFTYSLGHFVVLSGDLVRPMAEAARSAPFFWLDDVFMFGLLPHVVGDVRFAELGERSNLVFRSMAKVRSCFKRLGPTCSKTFLAVFDRTHYSKLWRTHCVFLWRILGESYGEVAEDAGRMEGMKATMESWFTESSTLEGELRFLLGVE